MEVVEPKLGAIKKMEPCPIEDLGWHFCFLSSEENGGREDALEPLHETSVMKAVFGKLEEIEDFSGAVEADGGTLLFRGKRGDPYGNETVLTEGQTKVWVSRHLKKELAVAAAVDQLARGGTTKRDAAKHERPGMKPKLLFRLVALLSNQRDGIKVFQTLLGDREAIENRLNGYKARAGGGPARRRESVARGVGKGPRGMRKKGEAVRRTRRDWHMGYGT